VHVDTISATIDLRNAQENQVDQLCGFRQERSFTVRPLKVASWSKPTTSQASCTRNADITKRSGDRVKGYLDGGAAAQNVA